MHAWTWNPLFFLGGDISLYQNQRVLSGGLDPWGVGSANLGRPVFCLEFSPNPFRTRVFPQSGGKMGCPKFADPTPHGANPPLKAL